jgi:hypothetical protein
VTVVEGTEDRDVKKKRCESFVDVIEPSTVREVYYTVVPYTVEEKYTETVTIPRIVTKEITKFVPQVQNQVMTQTTTAYRSVTKTRDVLVKVDGTRSQKKEIRMTGRKTRGWDLKAPWSDPIWDGCQEKILVNRFVPLT